MSTTEVKKLTPEELQEEWLKKFKPKKGPDVDPKANSEFSEDFRRIGYDDKDPKKSTTFANNLKVKDVPVGTKDSHKCKWCGTNFVIVVAQAHESKSGQCSKCLNATADVKRMVKKFGGWDKYDEGFKFVNKMEYKISNISDSKLPINLLGLHMKLRLRQDLMQITDSIKLRRLVDLNEPKIKEIKLSLGLNNKDDVILDKLYDYIYGGKKLDMKENDLVKLYESSNLFNLQLSPENEKHTKQTKNINTIENIRKTFYSTIASLFKSGPYLGERPEALRIREA